MTDDIKNTECDANAPAAAVIDLSGMDSVSSFHEMISKALPVPEYYGMNLDALNDFLTTYFKPLSITFANHEQAVENGCSKFVKNLKRMCDSASAENEYIEFIWK